MGPLVLMVGKEKLVHSIIILKKKFPYLHVQILYPESKSISRIQIQILHPESKFYIQNPNPNFIST